MESMSVVGTWAVALTLTAVAPLASADEQGPIERLKDKNRERQLEASRSILQERKSVIKELVAILSPESKGKYSWGTRYEAIRLLGQLRASDARAIDVLVANFDFDPWREANAGEDLLYPPQSEDLKLLGVETSRPVHLALVRIGMPAAKRARYHLAKVGEGREREFLVRVCVEIEGEEIRKTLPSGPAGKQEPAE